MRSTILLGLGLLCAGALIAIGLRATEATAVPAPQPTAVRWEYRALTEADLLGMTEGKTAEAGMNKLGDEGWELVAIKSTSSMKATPSLFCFKRFKGGR
jgi:hypothetical protein